MPTLKSSRFPPPRAWEEFELLCADLFRQLWNDPATQRNGRSGQLQHGVDIFGRPDGSREYVGVQVRNKVYPSSRVTVAELRKEVERAKSFTPVLKRFVIATTAPNDSVIQEEARRQTDANEAEGLFSVEVWGWDEIESRLVECPDVARHHYPQFGIAAVTNDGQTLSGHGSRLAGDALEYLDVLNRRLLELPPHLDAHLHEIDPRRSHFLDEVHQDIGVASGRAEHRQWRLAASNDVIVNDAIDLEQEISVTNGDEAITTLNRGGLVALVLGDAGLGKTWLLTRLARNYAESSADQLRAGRDVHDVELPLYVTCQDFLGRLRRNRNPLEAALDAGLGIAQSGRKFRKSLRSYTALASLKWCVMLDSFEDAPSSLVQVAIEELAREPNIFLLIAARPSDPRLATLALGERRRTLNLTGFRSGELESFVAKMVRDPEQQGSLQERLRTDAELRSLCSIPLMASFVCILAANSEPLPTRRSALLETILHKLIRNEHRQGEAAFDDSIEARLNLLSFVALSSAPMRPKGPVGMTDEELLSLLAAPSQFPVETVMAMESEAQSAWESRVGRGAVPRGKLPYLRWALTVSDGVLVRSAVTHRRVHFFHRTAHEYLCARALAGMTLAELRTVVWPHRRFEPFWTEVIVLTAGRLCDIEREDQARELVGWFLDEREGDAFRSMLILGARCLAEAVSIRSGWIWDEAIDRLVADLGSGSRSQRDQAASALAGLGTAALRVLLDYVVAGCPEELCEEVVRAIGLHASQDALPTLMEMARDPDVHVRVATAQALRPITQAEASLCLAELCQDSDRLVRRTAARSLADRYDLGARSALGALVGDSDDVVREIALGSLLSRGELGAMGSVQLLHDPSIGIRRLAAITLGRSNEPEAIVGLVEAARRYELVVRDMTFQFPHDDRRNWPIGIVRLGLIEDGTTDNLAKSQLPEANIKLGQMLTDADPWLRIAAASANWGELSARVAVLKEVISTGHSSLRAEAVRLLGELRSDDVAGFLGELLDDSDIWVRAGAARSLARHRTAVTTSRLIACLQGQPEEVKCAAAESLGEHMSEASVAPLTVLLSDESPRVVGAAATALNSIGSHGAMTALSAWLQNSMWQNAAVRDSETIARNILLIADAPGEELVKWRATGMSLEALYEAARFAAPSVYAEYPEKWASARSTCERLTEDVFRTGKENPDGVHMYVDNVRLHAEDLIDKALENLAPLAATCTLRDPQLLGEATRMIAVFRAKYPGSSRLSYLAGKAAVMRGEYRASIPLFLEAADLAVDNSNTALAGFAFGSAFMSSCAAGEPDSEFLRAAIQLLPAEPLAVVWSARGAIESGEPARALSLLTWRNRRRLTDPGLYFTSHRVLFAQTRAVARAAVGRPPWAVGEELFDAIRHGAGAEDLNLALGEIQRRNGTRALTSVLGALERKLAELRLRPKRNP